MRNIDLSPAPLKESERLQREAFEFGAKFAAEEDGDTFWIGCSDFTTNRASFWIIEVARRVAASADTNADAKARKCCADTTLKSACKI